MKIMASGYCVTTTAFLQRFESFESAVGATGMESTVDFADEKATEAVSRESQNVQGRGQN